RSPDREADPVERALHRTIKKVTEDLGRMAYNTAIAAMMEFVNVATAAEHIDADQLERFILVLSPFAPHICEELWHRLHEHGVSAATIPNSKAQNPQSNLDTLAYEPWPSYDESLTIESEIEIPVQINGKVRARIKVARDADAAAMEAAARA